VSRWSDGAWADVGGAPDIEALHADGFPRYGASGCSIAVAPGGRPVIAWSALTGVKYHAAYAATWRGGAWRMLGDRVGDERAVDARLTLDADGAPIVATFEAGGSYGGGATTRVYALDDRVWRLVGDAMTETSYPTVAAGTSFVYLALVAGDYVHETDRVHVYRSSLGRFGGGWHELGGALSAHGDDVPALALTSDDRPVVAFARGGGVVVRSRAGGGWRAVGEPVAGTGGYITALDLAVSPVDVPTFAWREQTFGDGATSSVRAFRWTDPLR
jgi:hypothetical protein